MAKLEPLCAENGQGPWLDNLTCGCPHDGISTRMTTDGIRWATASLTIFTKSVVGSTDYDEQRSVLAVAGYPVEDAYRQHAVDVSGDIAGFASAEVAAELARDTQAMVVTAHTSHEWITAPNLLLKPPTTVGGGPARQARDGIGLSLGDQGLNGFHTSDHQALAALVAKTRHLRRR